MKGLQGERLRQAFKYLDDNEDGFIRPEQFRRIIVVCLNGCLRLHNVHPFLVVGISGA